MSISTVIKSHTFTQRHHSSSFDDTTTTCEICKYENICKNIKWSSSLIESHQSFYITLCHFYFSNFIKLATVGDPLYGCCKMKIHCGRLLCGFFFHWISVQSLVCARCIKRQRKNEWMRIKKRENDWQKNSEHQWMLFRRVNIWKLYICFDWKWEYWMWDEESKK